MQRILYVCTVPTDTSGIPNVIFNLLDKFDYKNYEIGYVAINEPSDTYKEKLNRIGATLHVIPRKISNPLRYVYKLTKVAKEYEIIHVHGNSATMVLEMVAAKLAGVKFRIAHSHNTTCNMKLIDCLARPLFYRLCNGRLACGNEAGKWLFGDNEYKIVKNGISTEKFRFSPEKRDVMRRILDSTQEKCSSEKEKITIVGHIGNFVEAKNHQFLIRVFKEYHKYNPNSKLLLLGIGFLMNKVKETVNNLGLANSVIFVGSVDNPQDYMNAMDIIAMPSLYEGLPLTLIEAQANGLPIIAADTITSDANISGNISYCPISERNLDLWRRNLEEKLSCVGNRADNSQKAITLIKENGYDISLVTQELTDYYKNFFR